jgi:hypothetical protein
MALTVSDERMLVGLSLGADRERLARVAAAVLDRGDAVTGLLRAAAANEDGGAAWREAVAVLRRRGGNALNLLDLVVEVGQQELLRSGESRTWDWPTRELEERHDPADAASR